MTLLIPRMKLKVRNLLIKVGLVTETSQAFYLKSYALAGEDMILNHLLAKQRGFFVDIGAFHPWRYSNTFYFYQQGWRGINVDANPESINLFNTHRSEDINVEAAIFKDQQELTYYFFNHGMFNGFSKEALKDKTLYLVDEKKIQTKTLKTILQNYLPENQAIDFLSLDVEGFELEALQSNDWNKFRPEVVLVEAMRVPMEDAVVHPLTTFMRQNGYKLTVVTENNFIFRTARFEGVD
jgi:FkbM family methyltransferase